MLKNIIILPDGTELSSGILQANALRNVSITECVNSETELTLGSVCANMLEATVISPGGGLNIAAGDEVTLLKQAGDGTRTQVGLFTLERPTRSSANAYKITAYDRVSWLDRDLTAWLAGLDAWPYSLFDFAGMVCQACGLALANTELPNGDYQIQRFSASNITGRRLMQWVGEAAGRFCRAAADGKIEFAWYTPAEVSIGPTKGDGVYGFYQGSFSCEDYEVTQIDRVQIQLTEDDVGVAWPNLEEGNTYTITGNYLLTTEHSETLQPVAQTIFEGLQGVTYTPCKVSIPANLDIHAGNIVEITDLNGKTVTAYVMNKTQVGQQDTLEGTGSYSRDSSTFVNNESVKALSGKVFELKKSIDELSARARSIQTEIDGEIERVDKRISEAVQNSEGIILSALKEYAQTSDLEQVSSKINSELSLLADKMTLQFSQIDQADADLQEKYNKIATFFSFDVDGLTIGKSDNPYKVVIDNDDIRILVNNTTVQSFDAYGNAKIPSLNINDSLNLLGLAITRDDQGNINCEYVEVSGNG